MELGQIFEAFFKVVVLVCVVILAADRNRLRDELDAATTMIVNLASGLVGAKEEVNDDIDDVRNYITEVETEILEKVNALQDKYDEAEDMIQQVKQTAKDAAETEKKVQDGIDSILNYSGIQTIMNTIGK